MTTHLAELKRQVIAATITAELLASRVRLLSLRISLMEEAINDQSGSEAAVQKSENEMPEVPQG